LGKENRYTEKKESGIIEKVGTEAHSEKNGDLLRLRRKRGDLLGEKKRRCLLRWRMLRGEGIIGQQGEGTYWR